MNSPISPRGLAPTAFAALLLFLTVFFFVVFVAAALSFAATAFFLALPISSVPSSSACIKPFVVCP